MTLSTLTKQDELALPKVAIVGSGIAGLSAAHALQGKALVTLFEAGAHFGGHANTVEVKIDDQMVGVDTGFLVFNERTYPGLIALLVQLQVATAPSNMGFSVQSVRSRGGKSETLVWAGNSLGSVFAQRKNLFRLHFWGMLADIVRFNRVASRMAKALEASGSDSMTNASGADSQTVGEFLLQQRLGEAFVQDYFLPMIACIWSCSPTQMMDFPIASLLRFCHNHGLLQIMNRPQWYTVVGGSRRYVEKITAGVPDKRLQCPVTRIERHSDHVIVHSPQRAERFDAVLLACHPDQSLRLLGADATELETQVLGAIHYQDNMAVLHTDARIMPSSRRAWAAWNYESHGNTTTTIRAPGKGADADEEGESRLLDAKYYSNDAGAKPDAHQVCLHYWLNVLQPLPTDVPIFVSLNPMRAPNPNQVLRRIAYAHPRFDHAALHAQQLLPKIQGKQGKGHTWYAGAWCRYGFHEDGFQAGLTAAQGLMRELERSRA